MKNYALKDENAVFYECGFSCDNQVFLKFGSEAFFITDARYTQEAKESIKNAMVVEGERGVLFKSVRELIRKARVKKLAYDPKEWSVDAFEKLSHKLHVEFYKVPSLSHKKRIIKTQQEQDFLRTASRLGAQAFATYEAFLRKKGLGLSEQELHWEAQAILKNRGSLELSFSPIVAINANASKPHALPAQTKLQKGDLLLLDAGIKYERYCSDRTRTACFDENFSFNKSKSRFSNATAQKVYDTVLKAQEKALSAIKVGVKAKKIDKIARDVIDKAGFGDFFIHSTGHGVGLDIHELPTISSHSESIIEEGMVFTVEPGIYIPNELGVRIEDMIIVTSSGAEVIG
ncbi:MAG: aminopeptidase P family protein [Sulfurospirillaceae bacterium]|nr:aminopeptidase P family protein [Sulfurospirillaceae bacterium]